MVEAVGAFEGKNSDAPTESRRSLWPDILSQQSVLNGNWNNR